MTKHKSELLAANSITVNLGGLDNQILYLPAKYHKNHNILLVYGHFGTLTNYFDLASDLSKYGNVTMADLPGFNNLSSLYKIHEKPTIDELAEYLATIVNYRFRKKKLTIIGIGFGTVIVTRMLQHQPSLVRKVNIVISIDGMAHHDDLNNLSSAQRKFYSWILSIFSHKLSSLIVKKTNIPDVIMGRIYCLRPKSHRTNANKQQLMDWRIHDFRTYMRTMSELLRLDNCNKAVKVKFTQVWSGTLTCLDREVTDQHLQVIYDDFELITSEQKISKRADSLRVMYSIALPKQLQKLLIKTAKSAPIE